MESFLEPSEKDYILKIGREFALEGLDWSDYKPMYSDEKHLKEERAVFEAGFQEGMKLVNQSNSEIFEQENGLGTKKN